MLLEQLNAAEKRMNEIKAEVRGLKADDPEGLKKIEALNEEYRSLSKKRAELRAAYEMEEVDVTTTPVIPLNEAAGEARSDDPLGTLEYRKAFMKFVQTGEKGEELRADATTKTSDVAALIPTTISNRVIEELDSYGGIYKRITNTNYKGGVAVPISTVKPTASWVAEGSTSEKKKLSVSGSVTFNYYKLQVKIARSLESTVTTVDAFEKIIANAIVRAMIVAIETAVISGTGTGQPTGLLNESRIVTGQKHIFTAATDATWKKWHSGFLSKIKSAYRNRPGNVILMNQATFDTYVSGMADENGQPVARVTFGLEGKPVYRFLGYDVEITDLLPSYDDADASAVFMIFGDLSEWSLNSNLQMTHRKYFDDDTDEYVDKVTMLADGKVLDAAGFVFLKKPAS
jgi:HK97 family phage major capsid protein